MVIETKRLKLRVMTDAEMEAIIESEESPEMKQAYSEMLCGAKEHPLEREWYAIWAIELKGGARIGDLCFKGVADGKTEIGYGIYDEFQGNGYMTEAAEAACDYAEKQGLVVEAEAEKDNLASLRVLEKCNFVYAGYDGEEGPRFIRKRKAF